MATTRRELTVLTRLALPVALTQVSNMLMGVTDLVMIGRVGVVDIGAVSIGNVWKVASLMVAMGIVMGMDPFVSQAHGARDRRALGLALQRGLVLALFLTVPVSALWILAEPALLLLDQDPETAYRASWYVLVQVPSVLPFLAFTVLRQYLTGRGIVYPALWVTIGANVVNVFLNWVLIFGHLGAPAMGAVGSGIATGLVQVGMFGAMLLWIVAGRLLRGGWIPWERASLLVRGLGPILHRGLPVGVTLGLELWAFSLATLFAGQLGRVDLAAHSIVLNLASLSFMMPLGISIGAATRVGNLLGAGRVEEAQKSAWVALALGAGVMSIAGTTFITGRSVLPWLYTSDAVLVAACARILPIAGTFQLFDGTQVVGCGILRGMGRTLPAAAFNLVGYYLVAAPFAYWLVTVRGLGLPGIWWGMVIGLGSVALLLVAWIGARGPARDPRARVYAT